MRFTSFVSLETECAISYNRYFSSGQGNESPYLNLIYIHETCFSVCLSFLYFTHFFSMPWNKTYKKIWKNFINTDWFCYKKKLYAKYL